MKLSIIIAAYNMDRELPRTLLSATAPYQRNVDPSDYEVIVVDNGSRNPVVIPGDVLAGMDPPPRVYRPRAPSPSPVAAMNFAARTLARGEIVLFAIDGARIFSDRLVAETLRAHRSIPGAFVYTLACHIGPKMQMLSTQEGYDEEAEDRLLADANWPLDAASIYGISVLAGSSAGGFFRPIAESNAFSMPRTLLERLGGYDERFVSPGAGLANLEFFARYVTRAEARNVCLLSDMTFHQTHGGIATSGRVGFSTFNAEYKQIFDVDYRIPEYEVLYQGPIRPEALPFVQQSLER